ncbi:MAG: hypothetical protein Q9180_007803 [Flavoplaca navasiana]
MISMCERAADPDEKDSCALCGQEMNLLALRLHVASHLEDVALFVLPGGSDEDDTDSGSTRSATPVERIDDAEQTNIGGTAVEEPAQDSVNPQHEESPSAVGYQLIEYRLSRTDLYQVMPSSAEVPRQMPSDLSCLVLYERLRPNYEKQPIRVGTDGGNKFWAPPNLKNAYLRDKANARLFRWIGGRMTDISAESTIDAKRSLYGVATVFTQWPDTPHLLAVTFDAEKKDVAEESGGWKVLSFDYIPQPGTQRLYSSVSVAGNYQQLAAPGPGLVPQLLPRIYDYNPLPHRTPPISAGLIGNLPILFALAAFSVHSGGLSKVLTSHIQPNRWCAHQFEHGREF